MKNEGTPVLYHAPGRGYYYLTPDRKVVWIANGWYFIRKRPAAAPGKEGVHETK